MSALGTGSIGPQRVGIAIQAAQPQRHLVLGGGRWRKTQDIQLRQDREAEDSGDHLRLVNGSRFQAGKDDGIWFTESQHEVVLKVSAEVAGYFKHRKLIANQVIEKELADGGLLISAKVGHPNQVLPIIRYWMPHIRIISPDSWQRDLEQGIMEYLQRIAD